MKDNFDTELECLTAFDIEEHSENLRVLVKHDYYSSDNEHGRIILDSLLDGLKNDSSKISSLIIIDSAVKLLSENGNLISLIASVDTVYISKDSIDFYNVDTDELPDNISFLSTNDLAEVIIDTMPNLILG